MSLLALCVSGCGGGGGDSGATSSTPAPSPTYSASAGLAQKGPLISASTVTVQELNTSLVPNGRQFSYQILTDLGNFTPTNTFTVPNVGVSAAGYYFDEVTNRVSTGPVTLTSYADFAADTTLNVNVLTTLAYQRVQRLVTNSGLSFAAARAQAEGEVLAAFGIPPGSASGFGALDISGSRDGDHILAAVSALLVYGNAAGPLSQLIANIQADIGANGRITSTATQTALQGAARSVNLDFVAANLAQKYGAAGGGITAAAITEWIDRDNDGVVGHNEYTVSNATPGTTFTIPAALVTAFTGASWSVSTGRLAINGAPITGVAAVRTGDVVTVTPATGLFPNGVLTVYISSGSTRIARVSFVSGLLSLVVTPANPAVAKGASRQFTATGTFSDTSVADLTSQVTWSSSLPAVATVTAAGVARGLAVGSSNITATSGTVSAFTTLNITAAVIASVAITPAPPTTGVGLAAQLNATATYTDATTANITDSVVWASATPAVATISTTGVLTGVALGTTTISATHPAMTATAQGRVVVNAWGPTGAMGAARDNPSATLLQSGKVLVAGGMSPLPGVGPLTSTEFFDPARGTWSIGPPLPADLSSNSAILLNTGRVFAVNGGTGSTALYDPVSNSWSQAAGMPVTGLKSATKLADGRVLMLGYTAAQLYDPVTNTWTAAASRSVGRQDYSTTLLPNGKVLVAGGSKGSHPFTVTYKTAEVYDPASNTWTAAASMNVARSSHEALLLANGKVLVTGGATDDFPTIPFYVFTATTELYDPVANSWTQMQSNQPILQATALSLPSGKALIAGGLVGSGSGGVVGSTSPSAGAYVFNPAANSWEGPTYMQLTRFGHTMTLLPNGTVLVTGGSGTDSTAELFYPGP